MRLHVHEWGAADAPPVICVHGVSAHGRRYRKLAEERLASRYRVLAPDLRGHARSDWEPPWNLETHLADLLETFGDLGPVPWIGHSFGGRLLLELAAREPERLTLAVLLDPAIQILPHVGFDFAQEAAKVHSFATVDEAIASRLASGAPTPREYVEEEAREHLVQEADGAFRWRYSRAAVAAMYGEICREAPRPAVLDGTPALLVHAEQFGLVRDEQLDEYGGVAELVAVPGGHIVYWDAFEQTADAVEEFLIRHTSVSHA